MRRLATFVLVGTVLFATTAIAQSATDANMEILVQKMKADKKLLVADNMDLTDAERKSFWPMYDAYQKELDQVNRQLGHTIKQYAEAYNNGTVSNDLAKKLLGEALAIEEAEVNLKRAGINAEFGRTSARTPRRWARCCRRRRSRATSRSRTRSERR